MAAFSTIALTTAAVVGAGASVAGAMGQKKAADQAAANDEAAAARAQENANAQAELIEKVSTYNVAETLLDAETVKARTALDVDMLGRVGAFQLGGITDTITATIRKAGYASDGITAAIGDAVRTSGYKLGQIDEETAYRQQILALRGDATRRDTADEVARLMGESGYERDTLTAKASHTLQEGMSAIRQAEARTAYEAADLRFAADDADASAAASVRRAGATLAIALQEEELARKQQTKTLGAARASAAKAGVDLSGSALDALVDDAGTTEMQALAIRYQGVMAADSYVEDVRGAGVRATRLRSQADFTESSGAAAVADLRMKTAVDVAEMRNAAVQTERRTAQQIATLTRQRDETLASLDAEGGYLTTRRDADRREATAAGVSTVGGLLRDRAEIGADMTAKVDALNKERDLTDYQYRVERETAAKDGAAQEAALRREADHLQWRSEIEADNMRQYGSSQASDLMARASMNRQVGRASLTGGVLGAAGSLLNAGVKVYDRLSVPSSTTGTRTQVDYSSGSWDVG